MPYGAPLARHVRSSENFGRFNRTSKSAWLRDLYICPLRGGEGSLRDRRIPSLDVKYYSKIILFCVATKGIWAIEHPGISRVVARRASVSGRWRRLDGLKEGDFIPLGKGRGRSQLGLNRSQLRFLEGQARLRDGAGSVSSPLR